MKAAFLEPKQKRALYNAIREYHSLSCSVDISQVYSSIISNKKSVCRYKDYVLKRIIKNSLQRLIHDGLLDSNQDVELHINIDEQLTATNGYYTLSDSIMEELAHGISNYDYGTFHERVFSGNVTVYIQYCESKTNYLIQASDILANRIWTSFRTGDASLRLGIPNHIHLTFP